MVVEIPIRRADDFADAGQHCGQFVHARVVGTPENDFMSSLSEPLAEIIEKDFSAATGAGTAAGEEDSHKKVEKEEGIKTKAETLKR